MRTRVFTCASTFSCTKRAVGVSEFFAVSLRCKKHGVPVAPMLAKMARFIRAPISLTTLAPDLTAFITSFLSQFINIFPFDVIKLDICGLSALAESPALGHSFKLSSKRWCLFHCDKKTSGQSDCQTPESTGRSQKPRSGFALVVSPVFGTINFVLPPAENLPY